VKQHLGRQSGVQSVEVSLLNGTVDITPKEDGHIDPSQLLKATYDSGVTAAEMDITARGKIVKNGSDFAFEIAPNQSFALDENELSKSLEPLTDTAAIVTLRGQLYKKPPGKKPPLPASFKLLALEIQKKE
jgi:hypothetical protein